LDNTTFEIAEKKYLNLETKEDSTNSLEKYLNEFPEGAHKTKANYYLASFFFKVKKIEKAVPYYQFIIAANSVEYTEESLSKLAQIYLDKREFNQALPLLKRLEQEGYIIENIIFAQSNLMQGYYEQLNYPRSIEYALKILKIKNTGTELENDAKTIVARASIEIKDFSTAAAYYADLETSSNGILKAEALYYNAYFKNEQKEYEASNDVVQELIAKYTTYKYWAVKSYVVMGKNYYGLKDVYQATFVLENVIKNFSEFEEIIKDAERLLKVIKETEAKINNSVTPVKKN
jgi:TolA-binding protein